MYKYFSAVRHVQVDMYMEMRSDHEKSNLPSRQRVTRVDEEGRTAVYNKNAIDRDIDIANSYIALALALAIDHMIIKMHLRAYEKVQCRPEKFNSGPRRAAD